MLSCLNGTFCICTKTEHAIFSAYLLNPLLKSNWLGKPCFKQRYIVVLMIICRGVCNFFVDTNRLLYPQHAESLLFFFVVMVHWNISCLCVCRSICFGILYAIYLMYYWSSKNAGYLCINMTIEEDEHRRCLFSKKPKRWLVY